jgi:hypothetical protein
VGAKGKRLKKTGPEPAEDEEDAKDLEDQNATPLSEKKIMTKEEV